MDKLLLNLCRSLFTCVSEPEYWTKFLTLACKSLDAHSGALVLELSGRKTRLLYSLKFPGELLHTYFSQFAADDAALQRIQEKEVGSVFTCEMLLGRNEFLGSRVYKEFLKPVDVRYRMVCVVSRNRAATTVLILLNNHAAEPFGRKQLELMRQLAPHLKTVVSASRLTSPISCPGAAWLECLDFISTAVFLLDAEGTVLRHNMAAEQLLKKKDGISIQREKLNGLNGLATTNLRDCISKAASVKSDTHEVESIALPGKDGGRHLVSAVPLYPTAVGASYVLTLVNSTSSLHPYDHDRARTLWGFSPAECRLAGALLAGLSVDEISETLDISPHTIRNQLKSIFHKTGTSRQSDLVRILTLSAQLLPSRG